MEEAPAENGPVWGEVVVQDPVPIAFAGPRHAELDIGRQEHPPVASQRH